MMIWNEFESNVINWIDIIMKVVYFEF